MRFRCARYVEPVGWITRDRHLEVEHRPFQGRRTTDMRIVIIDSSSVDSLFFPPGPHVSSSSSSYLSSTAAPFPSPHRNPVPRAVPRARPLRRHQNRLDTHRQEPLMATANVRSVILSVESITCGTGERAIYDLNAESSIDLENVDREVARHGRANSYGNRIASSDDI